MDTLLDTTELQTEQQRVTYGLTSVRGAGNSNIMNGLYKNR